MLQGKGRLLQLLVGHDIDSGQVLDVEVNPLHAFLGVAAHLIAFPIECEVRVHRHVVAEQIRVLSIAIEE